MKHYQAVKRAITLGLLLLTLALLASLYLLAYFHTSQGAPFGCWPESFPPLPASVEYQYEVYCGA